MGRLSNLALGALLLALIASPAPVWATDDTTVLVDDTTVSDPPPIAPVEPASRFLGTVATPARGQTTVHVVGDMVLDPQSCERSPVNGWLPFRTFAGFLPVGSPSLWREERPIVHNVVYATTNYLDRYAELPAGTYRLHAWAGYSDPGDQVFRDCGPLSDQIVTIVDRVSTQLGIAADDTELVLGEHSFVSFVERVTWTDGAVTQSTPAEAGNLSLQSRLLGTSEWTTDSVVYVPWESGHGTRRVVMPGAPTEYRFLLGGVPSRSVVISVARPTLGRQVSAATLSDSESMMGASIEIRADLQTQYTDAQWRPSPEGTTYEVQFLPAGGEEWIRLYLATTVDVGGARLRFPVEGAGRYRIASGGGVGASATLSILQPTSTVAIEPPDVPTRVSPGTPVNLSSTVNIQYSDGLFRPAPDGTSFRVQFAASGPRSKLRWKTITRGKVRAGEISTRIRPRSTGYWRVVTAGSSTSAVLITVRKK